MSLSLPLDGQDPDAHHVAVAQSVTSNPDGTFTVVAGPTGFHGSLADNNNVGAPPAQYIADIPITNFNTTNNIVSFFFDNLDGSTTPGNADPTVGPTFGGVVLGYDSIDQFYLVDFITGFTPVSSGGAPPDGQYVGTLSTNHFEIFAVGTADLDTATAPQHSFVFGPTPPCFTAGTRIATPSGETPVERLRIGDLVMTVDGCAKPVKWLGRRGYGARAVASSPAVQPVRIRAGALGEASPRRDLIVSPQHAMLIEGMLIPAAALVNDVSIVRCRNYGEVSYIHIELDEHDAILAEGAPTETFVDDNSRAMFQNAAEYAALYPNETPHEPVFIAPRVECGEALEAVRQRLASRAGLWQQPVAEPGPMLGHVERIGACGGDLCIEGWVLDIANPRQPVRLEVLIGERVVARTLANRYRADLEAADLAGGRCAFAMSVPAADGPVAVRRSADGAALPIAAQETELAQAA